MVLCDLTTRPQQICRYTFRIKMVYCYQIERKRFENRKENTLKLEDTNFTPIQ